MERLKNLFSKYKILLVVLLVSKLLFAFSTPGKIVIGGEGTNGNYYVPFDTRTETLRIINLKQGDQALDSLLVHVNNNGNEYVRRISPISTLLTNYVPISRTITINGVTQDLSSNRSWTVSGKRQETYSGVTSGSGTYSVTYSIPYSVAPNVHAEIIGGATTNFSRVTSSSTTGFTVTTNNTVNVIGLLPTYPTINGLTVNVTVFER